MSWKTRTRPDTDNRPNCRELRRALQCAGPEYVSESGVEITLNRHFNGGGPTAFGGARDWPHLKLDVSFPTNDYAARDAFAAKLQAFIDQELPEPISKSPSA